MCLLGSELLVPRKCILLYSSFSMQVLPGTWSVLGGKWVNACVLSFALIFGMPSLIICIHVIHKEQLRAQTPWLEILQRAGEEWNLLEAQNLNYKASRTCFISSPLCSPHCLLGTLQRILLRIYFHVFCIWSSIRSFHLQSRLASRVNWIMSWLIKTSDAD